ncbi:hypothetical protein CHS0354_016924 [Potamilus streckersoni]|uniref:Heat shock 70 kDa protein 12A n=1 Tax=Potamilus streckersoni TaxID=2493646 RepID=A0AAE0VY29_9BIVA|nr:hypothetical protein CHS0354_016924 [Potamilus streckersoni]
MASKIKLMVAAVDFGTTFSSWAFSFKHEFEKDPTKVHTKNWNSGQSISHKAPTTALIRSDGMTLEAFGYEAEDKYASLVAEETHKVWYYFQRFKMSLFENKTLNRQTEIEDVNGKKLTALRVFSLVIEYLKNNLVDECKMKITNGEFDESNIHWVLTVPAIWDDKAKQFMREAAIQAGIGKQQVMIALEPEAASLFCRHIPLQVMSSEVVPLDAGTRYIVIDAGGGTVDITIHEIMEDGNIKELNKATGGAWGGQEVDEAFKQFLIQIFGNGVFQKFKSNAVEDYFTLFREFEVKKRKITPNGKDKVVIIIPAKLKELFESETGEAFNKCISRSEFASQVELTKGNKLRLDSSVMKGFFEKATESVVEHVKTFHDSDKYDINVALMVGGFSESSMLVSAVRDACSSWKVVVPNEAGLVVLKGAVIFGHNPTPITYRVSRHTYGYRNSQPFIEGTHANEHMVVYDGEKFCRNIFSLFLQEGDLVYDGQIFVDRKPFWPTSEGDTFGIEIYASNDKNVQYTTENSCTYLGLLTVDKLDADVPIEERMAYVTIKVTNSELQMEATDPNTGRFIKTSIDFLQESA